MTLDHITDDVKLSGLDDEEVATLEEVQHNFSHSPVSMASKDERGEGETDSDGTTGEEGEYELEEDIFSMIFVSPVCSMPFLYALFVFILQMAILILALYNILRDADPDKNKLHIPPYTNTEVQLSQCIALLIALFTSDDVITSLDALLVRYDNDVRLENKGATKSKWIFSHLCRFLEGLLGIVVAFFFIVQATDVLDLFLDFLAVQFVSELDNVGFYLAKKGYLNFPSIKETTESIAITKMKQNLKGGINEPDALKRARKFRKRIQLGVFYTILAISYVLFFVVMTYQGLGTYFRMECERFQIIFPDLEYHFFPKCKGTERDNCLEGWEGRTSVLRYSDFNGLYVAEMKNGWQIEREDHFPVYRQRLAGDSDFGKDSPAGEIRYCKKEEAWVFRIPHVSKGSNADDCSWLLKSPETDALSLNHVPEEDWKVWTGTIDEGTVDITCVECVNEDLAENQIYHIGCNFHGECRGDGTCSCQDGFVGAQCSTCADCSVIDIESNVRDSFGYELKWKWPGTFHRLDYPDGTAFDLYDRPVFYYMKGETIDVGVPAPLIVFFYWADQYALWDFSDRVSCTAGISCNTNQQIDELREFLEAFHPLWDFLEDKKKPEYVSEQTSARSGMKGLKWRGYEDYLENSDFSIGKFSELNFNCESYEFGGICEN